MAGAQKAKTLQVEGGLCTGDLKGCAGKPKTIRVERVLFVGDPKSCTTSANLKTGIKKILTPTFQVATLQSLPRPERLHNPQ